MLKDIESLQNKNDELTKSRDEGLEKITKLTEEIEELKKQVSSLTSEVFFRQLSGKLIIICQKQELGEEQEQRANLLDKYENQLEYLQAHQIEVNKKTNTILFLY